MAAAPGRHGVIGAAFLALVALCPSAVSATDAASLAACWRPEALVGKPGERYARKQMRAFDAPSTDTEALAPVPEGVPYGAIRSVRLPAAKKLIALTFDLCEQQGEIAGYDGSIIDFLRREGIKATFFAGGKWMRSHVERTEQLMADPLFELANHSEAHRNLRLLQGERLREEVAGPQRAYETIRAGLARSQCAAAHPQAMQSIAPRLMLFRFPYGACNPAALREVQAHGLRAVQWDIATGDPDRLQSAAAIVRAMQQAKPGSIILNHANGRGWHTAAALPEAVSRLRQKGFAFVTVSELLAAGEPEVADICYNARPGDTNRYDIVRRLRPMARKSATQLQ